MAETFLFYDLETTGLSRAFDQILDFAAIRTDPELNELERLRTRVRLRPDVVPSPGAMLVNRIRVAQFPQGECEFEAMRRIHGWLNTPQTVSIGYNSIGFDDEFLRFSFHRNLLPPYAHQFANGCRRMDLLPITIVYWLFHRDVLAWPEPNGNASLRLEDIGAANALFTGKSHDAAADVEAALRLARRLFREQKTWRYLEGCFQGEIDSRRAADLPAAFQGSDGPHALAVLVDGVFGTRQRFLAPVLAIGHSVPYPKQGLWLRLDLPQLRETRAESAAETSWVVRKRYGEPGVLLPAHERYLAQIDPQRREVMAENIDWLEANPELLAAIVRHHRDYRHPFIPDLDADASLYQSGFLSRPDEALCRSFHAAPGPERIGIAGRFSSPEARTLATRVLFRNFPGELAPALQNEFAAHMGRIRRGDPTPDHAGRPRLTPQGALAAARELRQAAAPEPEQLLLIEELERYITRQFG
jgi:exodeoxyribonuclease-1